jgi:hypothetical protein
MYNNLDNNIDSFKSSIIHKLINEKDLLIHDLETENKSLKSKINYLIKELDQSKNISVVSVSNNEEIIKIKSELSELKNRPPIQNIIYTTCKNCSQYSSSDSQSINKSSISDSTPIAPPPPSTPSNSNSNNTYSRSLNKPIIVTNDDKNTSNQRSGSYFGGRSLVVPHEHKESNVNYNSISHEANLSVKDVLKNISSKNSSKKGSGSMADVLEQLKNVIKSRNQ